MQGVQQVAPRLVDLVLGGRRVVVDLDRRVERLLELLLHRRDQVVHVARVDARLRVVDHRLQGGLAHRLKRKAKRRVQGVHRSGIRIGILADEFRLAAVHRHRAEDSAVHRRREVKRERFAVCNVRLLVGAEEVGDGLLFPVDPQLCILAVKGHGQVRRLRRGLPNLHGRILQRAADVVAVHCQGVTLPIPMV